MMTVEDRLATKGVLIPTLPDPVGQFLPARQVDQLLYLSGQGPILAGIPTCLGQVGGGVSTEEAYEAARLCALNCLAAIKAVTGSLDTVEEVVQVRGYVSSSADFHDHPKVVNGASDLLIEAFGDRGRHARTAIGVSVLPGNIPVEVDMVVRLTAPKRDVHGSGCCNPNS